MTDEEKKELEQWKQEWQDAQIKANEEGFARTTLQIKYSELEKENEQLKAEIANYEETVDRLYEDQKDLAGELELWQRENAELKKENTKLLDKLNLQNQRLNELKKENAELNRDKTELVNSVTELKNKITELEKQIDQLSNDNYVLKTSFITQQAQIEKMKCCGNCSKKHQCKMNVIDSLHCDKWS